MRIFIKPKQELSQRKQEQGPNEIQRPFVLNPAHLFSQKRHYYLPRLLRPFTAMGTASKNDSTSAHA